VDLTIKRSLMGSSMAAGVFTGAGGFAFKVDGHLQFHNGLE